MITIGPKFQKIIPDGTVTGAIEFLNSLDWNVSLNKNDEGMILLTGEHRLAISTNEDELNSFIRGMAFGLAILPQEILDEIRKIIGSD